MNASVGVGVLLHSITSLPVSPLPIPFTLCLPPFPSLWYLICPSSYFDPPFPSSPTCLSTLFIPSLLSVPYRGLGFPEIPPPLPQSHIFEPYLLTVSNENAQALSDLSLYFVHSFTSQRSTQRVGVPRDFLALPHPNLMYLPQALLTLLYPPKWDQIPAQFSNKR